MIKWNWIAVQKGLAQYSLLLSIFSFSYQNLIWLNSHFLSWLPIGHILLGGSGIFIILHLNRTLRWFAVWLNGKRYQKYEKLFIHICLYLIITSIVLSIPMTINT